jgi:hypothetical protein
MQLKMFALQILEPAHLLSKLFWFFSRKFHRRVFDLSGEAGQSVAPDDIGLLQEEVSLGNNLNKN